MGTSFTYRSLGIAVELLEPQFLHLNRANDYIYFPISL